MSASAQLSRNIQGFSPSNVSGCYLWLDGKDPLGTGTPPATGSLSTWFDKSGRGFNATSTTSPTYNSTLTRVEFNGGTQFMSNLSYSLNMSSRSIFIVMAEATRTNVAGVFPQIPSPTTGTDYQTSNGLTIETSSGLRFYGNSGRYISDVGSTTLLVQAIYNDNMNGTQGSSFLNGTNTSNNVATYTGGAGGGYGIGRRWANGPSAPSLNGYIFEIIVFNTPLATASRQQIEGFLAWKWALQSFLPSNHPYKNNAPFQNTYSLPISITTPVSFSNLTLFNPLQVSGCQLWFDAADETTFTKPSNLISGWRDKSSNNYQVLQAIGSNQPTFVSAAQNGLSGIQFQTTTFLSNATSNMPNFTTSAATSVMIVAKNADTNTGWNIVNTVWFTNQSAGTQRYHFSFNWTTTDGLTLFVNPTVSRVGPATVVPAQTTAILGFTVGASLTTLHVNGDSNAYGGYTLQSANDGTYFIFNDARFVNTAASNIMIFEMVGYDNQISTSNRQQLEGYLAWKWGLTSSLPNNHPYKTIPLYPFSYTPTARITQNATFVPPQITGCQIWIDSYDPSSIQITNNVVSGIIDKSGSNTTYSITNTVSYNFKNALIFSQTNGVVTITSTNPTVPFDYFFVGTAPPSNTAWRTLLRTVGSSAGTHFFLLESGTNKAGMYTGTSFSQFGSYTMIPNEKAMFYGSVSVSTTIRASKNGDISLTSESPAGVSNTLGVIGNLTPGGQPFGSVHEVVIYNTTLSLSQRQQVEGYLAWKWGLQTSLPSNHPYALVPPLPF